MPETYEDMWVISGRTLLALLQRVAEGESPVAVYAEYYANARHAPPTSGS